MPSRLKKAYDGRFEDVSAAVLVATSPDGQIVSVNGEAEELTGYERVELESMCLAEIFRSEDQHRITSLFSSSLHLDFRKLFEHNVIVSKRSRRKIMVDMGFRRTTVSGVDAYVFTLQDITEIKTNEQRVVRAHEYVKNVIDSIVEIMVVTDTNGVLESANDAALKLLGYEESELVGISVARLFPDLAESERFDTELAETEAQVVAKDGHRLPVLVSRSRLKASSELSAGARIVLVAMDISERKKADALISQQQMTIAQAAKMSALGEMASSIAHEINNPLQVILGRCELLDMQTETVQPDIVAVRATMAMIDKMSQRINRIVRGLQSHARDQRHDPDEQIDLRHIINDTLSLCEQRIRNKVADFSLPEVNDAIYINCRPTQISQVLLNLLNNSYDEVSGTKNSFIRIEVTTTLDAVEIAVVDSGSGIPKDVADKLFTPFFTTKPVGQGTGLGLSLSKSLIEAHGGSLMLDRQSLSTRFVIRLPLCGAGMKAG